MSDDGIKCPECGHSLDETSGATAVLPSVNKEPQAIHSTESADGARFAAGTMLAERYRIVSLLGRGGMGEVYKAEDLKLKQIVALKLLPEALALDSAALARFHNEVSITRQISHPNVCRVYDIADAEGMHFLSMEFIDGEDLSRLLRRIGRLPGDKATEIARQICAGLAAAHDNGVLHRDLKPANIMIDGRGKARVTDFGVAVVARELRGGEAASGTAAYMAPEQLRGEEVTQRSDIYSLGLVLYELFTGKRVYDSDNIHELRRLHEQSAPTTPSSHIQNIDPLVERVILRCLEKEPKKRPASAIQVAAALPGGDPLAAALAAGETPSPEMVAASGENTGLKPAIAVALFGWIVMCLVVIAAFGNLVNWRAQALRENAPDDLTRKAREVISKLGYTETPVDTARGLNSVGFTPEYLRYINEKAGPDADRWNAAITAKPSSLYFWYRQSPEYLQPWDSDNFGWVTENDPAATFTPGMIWVRLEPNGNLRSFQTVPLKRSVARDANAASTEWAQLFSFAGLEMSAFTPAEPIWTHPVQSDEQAAWMGSYPGQPGIPIRVEAASYAGRPVSFFIKAPWDREPAAVSPGSTAGEYITFAIPLVLLGVLLVGAIWLARKNIRRGRGDRRGAARLALIVFGLTLLTWVFGADHNPTEGELVNFFFVALAQSFLAGAFVWLFYIALEPYVRRRWPEMIVSWTRAISGDLRNALVGKHILIGVAVALTTVVLAHLREVITYSLGSTPNIPALVHQLIGMRQFIAAGIFASINASVIFALFMFFFVFLLRVITRRRWLTCVIFVSLFTVMDSVTSTEPLTTVPLSIMLNLMLVVTMLRFGLLSTVIAGAVSYMVRFAFVTANLSAWHSGYMIIVYALVLALTAFAFHQSLGGQRLFREGLLDE
jgi:serine/threonine-protein kinase